MKHLMLAAAILFAPLSAGAATVFSDNFETPKITDEFPGATWRVYDEFGAWQTTSGSGIEIQRNGAVGGIFAKSGSQYVELDSDNQNGGLPNQPKNSSMTTKLNLAGGKYRVDWFYQPRTSTLNDNIIEVFLVGAGQGLFDNLIGSMNEVRTSTTDWVQVTNFFTVSGPLSEYALTFRAFGGPTEPGGLGGNELGGYIDDVSVSPVPVPAAGFLLIGALGGLVALRRRKTTA